MNFETRLAQTLHNISFSKIDSIGLSSKDIISLIDLTLLDTNATVKDIYELALKANHNHVAAICVLPAQLNHIPAEIDITGATVINFPTGNLQQQLVLREIEQTSTLVDEIDYVFPYQAYLAGKQNKALSYCHEAFKLCKQLGISFKVILETGAFACYEDIYDLSLAIIHNGCDFIKTSTGKIANGATISAVFAILSAISDYNVPCGIKVSGGIRTVEQAISYMQLARYMRNRKLDKTWFRLGASSLLDACIGRMNPS